jgi:hypothetical protein
VEYKYKTIDIFADINGSLIVIPHGRNEQTGGTINIDIVHHLTSSNNREELERTIILAFEECYSIKPNIDLKYSVVERYLGIKGYGKATKDKKLVTISWWQGKGFEIEPWKKMNKPPKGHYTLIKDGVIKIGIEPKTGELAEAVRKAIDIATI